MSFIPVDWPYWLRKLAAFRRTHGHCRVPPKWPADRALADWAWQIRAQLSSMPLEKLAQLHRCGFYFGRDASWVACFVDLMAYQHAHGHCRVPRGWRENRLLPGWVRNQRRLREGMAVQRRKLLERIGMDWSPRESVWNQRYADLCAFKKRHGHCRVPQRWRQDRPLASWVVRARQERRRLSPVRRRLLDKIGFEWDPFEDLWQRHYGELVKFRKRFGHCNVPIRWKENPRLARWVQLLRWEQERVSTRWKKRLDKLEFQWAGRSEWYWEKYFLQLAAFRKTHGHCNVPVRYRENPRLGRWVTVQRSSQDSLSKQHKRKLDQLGFAWRRRIASPQRPWQEWFKDLAAFKRRFGHCNVPYRWPENRALGHWVTNQRNIFKSMRGSPRKRRLDQLGFCWNPR